jgi:hypothetical protein
MDPNFIVDEIWRFIVLVGLARIAPFLLFALFALLTAPLFDRLKGRDYYRERQTKK